MIAWIDASVGVAGDMLLAALIDAGADADRVRAGLAGLALPGWELTLEEVHRGAFRALHARVRLDGRDADPAAGPEVAPGAPAPRFTGIAPLAAAHANVHAHAHGADHVHRPWRDIRALLQSAPLPERARARALAVYGRLAEAEARLHGMPVDDVELHEVGAVDAVIDIVGVCLALEDLGVDELVATPLPMGTGAVQAAHGQIPLPAPATLDLVRGWPIVPGRPGEWVTPTGAALITGLAKPGGPPAMVPERIGHGAGRKDPPAVANLVRVLVGRAAAPAGDEVVELACNLDDFTGELAAPLVSALLEAGALDAWFTPIVMKKGRPAFTLHALARPDRADALSELILRQSSSLGVRRATWRRDVLDRRSEEVQTPWGAVRIKVGGRGGEDWHAAPELEDVLAAAKAGGVSPLEVHRLALAAWSALRVGRTGSTRPR